MERHDYHPEDTPIPDEWELDGEPIYVDDDDEDRLEQKIHEWKYILRNIGGVVTMAAHKKELAPKMWVNQGFAIKWNSYAPGERATEQQQPRNRAERRAQRPKRDEVKPSPPPADPADTDDDEGLEPDGGSVVDEAEVDPDNADIRPDHQHDPAKVFAGEAQ